MLNKKQFSLLKILFLLVICRIFALKSYVYILKTPKMLSFFKDYKYFGIVFLIISVIIISIFYSILKVEKPLPIYQPSMVNYEMVDSTIQYQIKYHKIADFSLINQNGQTITQDTYKDKIYVADSFLQPVKLFAQL